MDVEEILSHHGIKGQRWGIRHKPNPTTGRVSSEDFLNARNLRSNPHRVLSNREIEIANNRANLENNFSRLNPGKRQRGEAHIKGILATVGIAASIASLANGPLGQLIIKAGKKSATKTLKIAGPRTFT